MKIAIIGIGGRTGTMFAFELRNSAEILGIGGEKEVKLIKEGRIYLERKGSKPEKFEAEVVSQEEFNEEIVPDFVFFAVKNPIGPAVKYYYQKFKESEKIPSLILSQNGISAVEEAKKELEEIFGEISKKIRIIRISLFNPISSEKNNDEIKISYFLPIRLALGLTSGPKEIEDIKEIFERAGVEAEEIAPENVKNMEYSKLFINLIGMASTAKGLTIEEGFKNKETFEEEIRALREYIKVVKKDGGKFLNLHHYPIKLFVLFCNFFPITFLKIFRKTIAKIITKGRGGKEKGNIDEIEYYNGAVIKLGEKLGIETPVNAKILKRVLKQM